MKKFDVLIVGGGTAGCACAYTCGKLGLKTLLIEKNSFLGGSITSSLVIPAMKISQNAINTEFYDILYNKLHELNGAITYSDGNKGWFNPELTKIVLDKLMLDAGVYLMYESTIQKITKNLSTYTVTIEGNNSYCSLQSLLSCIDTNHIVDATGNAEICFKIKSEDINSKIEFFDEKSQPVNLRFIMSGVNTDTFSAWLTKFDEDRNVTTCCNIEGYTMFSTAYTWDSNIKWALKPLFDKAVADGVLTESDSNYFQIFSVAGTHDSVAFNCPRILESNLSVTEAYIKGRDSILRIFEFCKKYLTGFEDAHISSIANSLGVRVSRRVKGKYIYTKNDLISGKKFENPVVISNYPIDVHSSEKDKSKLETVLQEYSLPVESLIVDDNLFVAGRCISADFESQAALRIIPSCFSMGEGLAKYIHSVN